MLFCSWYNLGRERGIYFYFAFKGYLKHFQKETIAIDVAKSI
jgi:hypothetical protein